MEPAELGLELGWLEQPPPRGVTVELAEALERDPDAELVWEMEEPPGFGLPAITSQTWREPENRIWFGNTLNMALRIHPAENLVTVAAKDGDRQVILEALASIALPMLSQTQGSLVLHASAASLDDRAVLLCAPGGSGKSSLMVGLIAAGWQAISEDQCVIDVDANGGHRVWPGPSWVRFKQGVAPVSPVTERRFEAVDKVAWRVNGWMAHTPAALERIVFLEPPGEEDVLWEPMSAEAAIPRLAAQATWLQDQDRFARSVLPAVVNLANRVPAFRMRLPRRSDWLCHGVAVLTDR